MQARRKQLRHGCFCALYWETFVNHHLRLWTLYPHCHLSRLIYRILILPPPVCLQPDTNLIKHPFPCYPVRFRWIMPSTQDILPKVLLHPPANHQRNLLHRVLLLVTFHLSALHLSLLQRLRLTDLLQFYLLYHRQYILAALPILVYPDSVPPLQYLRNDHVYTLLTLMPMERDLYMVLRARARVI